MLLRIFVSDMYAFTYFEFLWNPRRSAKPLPTLLKNDFMFIAVHFVSFILDSFGEKWKRASVYAYVGPPAKKSDKQGNYMGVLRVPYVSLKKEKYARFAEKPRIFVNVL